MELVDTVASRARRHTFERFHHVSRSASVGERIAHTTRGHGGTCYGDPALSPASSLPPSLSRSLCLSHGQTCINNTPGKSHAAVHHPSHISTIHAFHRSLNNSRAHRRNKVPELARLELPVRLHAAVATGKRRWRRRPRFRGLVLVVGFAVVLDGAARTA